MWLPDRKIASLLLIRILLPVIDPSKGRGAASDGAFHRAMKILLSSLAPASLFLECCVVG